jgi:hypothetical protein
MKPADILILKEIQEINRRLLAHQIETTDRFDAIDDQLDEILDEVEGKPLENRFVSPELEEAIKKVALRATSIDQKVSDL